MERRFLRRFLPEKVPPLEKNFQGYNRHGPISLERESIKKQSEVDPTQGLQPRFVHIDESIIIFFAFCRKFVPSVFAWLLIPLVSVGPEQLPLLF